MQKYIWLSDLPTALDKIAAEFQAFQKVIDWK